MYDELNRIVSRNVPPMRNYYHAPSYQSSYNNNNAVLYYNNNNKFALSPISNCSEDCIN